MDGSRRGSLRLENGPGLAKSRDNHPGPGTWIERRETIRDRAAVRRAGVVGARGASAMPRRRSTAAGGPDALGPGRLDTYLFYWIGQIDNLYKRAILDALRPMRINLPWWRTLAVLTERGPVTVGELARITVIERTALTRVIDQMVKRGFVRRIGRKGDGRVVEIHIEPEGRALYRRILPEARAVYGRAVAGLSPRQVAALIAELKHIRERLPGP